MSTRASGLSGGTWIRRGPVLVALVAMLAAVLAPVSAGPDPAADEQATGTLQLAMVELLQQDDLTSPVTLSSLRNDLFRYRGFNGGNGSGVDVALIDSGVAPVDGLDDPSTVIHGPDLSFEGATAAVTSLDTYGHGTHMAGIIAGDRSGSLGVAPGARIVSVKVAGHDGITSVGQVVAGIDWVIDHRNSDGLNIRVLNLSLGAAGVDSHEGDIMSAAVERAWDAGIFVVVAAGNRGETQPHLDSPAIDPFVMAVGASDSTDGQRSYRQTVPSWSALGDGVRNPDLVAPGRSIASYRVPGSTIDVAMPTARVGNDLFLGSGTSQAAAAVSGLAARLISERPDLGPDAVKASMTDGTFPLIYVGELKGGEGRAQRDTLVSNVPPQDHDRAAGVGSGIATPSGGTWSGGTWSGGTWSGGTWSGGTWSGGTWSGGTWSGGTWSGGTWSGGTWSGVTWSGDGWS